METVLATTAALLTVRNAWAMATDVERVARMRDAIVWAGFTIQRRTEHAETLFVEWIKRGRPMATGDLGITARYFHKAQDDRVADAMALSADTLLTIASLAPLGDGRAEAMLAQHVRGISIVKASFALASAGVGRLGCLDSRGIDRHAEYLRGAWGIDADADIRQAASKVLSRKAYKTGPAYVELITKLWGKDSADGQWLEWLEDMATDERATSHECLTYLGKDA